MRIYGGLTESVRCHKIVLAAFSSVIEAALADTDYDDETTVIIPDMTLDDLTAIVEFVYYRSMTLQADILFLKHACSILRQSSNPVCGS